MTREELQRKEELEWAARFFHHHFGQVPEFENLPTNSRPDVCVRFNGKRVGIELTRAINPVQAVFDTFTKSLLGAARARHLKLGGLHGRVTVSFRHRFNPNAYHRKKLGIELGEVVAARWTDSDDLTIITPSDLSPELRALVTEVRAFGHQGATFAHWNTPTAARVQPINAQTLQPIIDAKAAGLSDYWTMDCDEIWLLIYARFGKTAEIFDAAAGFDPCALRSGFDRTFFYDSWRSQELAAGSSMR